MYHYYSRLPSVLSSLPSEVPTGSGTKRRRLNSPNNFLPTPIPNNNNTTTSSTSPYLSFPSSSSSSSSSRIPSHQMSITSSTTVSRIRSSIPTVSPYSTAAAASTTLRDITNQNGTPSTKITTPRDHQSSINTSTNSSCCHIGFGDRAVVELVKSRQRKILKDINHFKRSVLELDKELCRVEQNSIPSIQRDIADGLSGVKLLEADISALDAELRAVELELVNLREQMELTNKNVQLDYKIKLSEYESELSGILESKRLELEKELLHVDSMRPSEQVLNEMATLNDELVEVGNQWASLSLKNKEMCREYETQTLGPELEEFKEIRLDSLVKSQESYKSLETRKNELMSTFNLKVVRIDRLTEEAGSLQKEIQQTSQAIIQGERNLKSLKEEHQLKTSKCITKLAERASVEGEFQKVNSKYETQLAKLSVEQRRCRGLQLSINDSLKRVSTICYTCDSDKNFPIDQQSMLTSQFDNVISFSRNFLINSLRKLFELEVQPFLERNIRGGNLSHCNLFHVDISAIDKLSYDDTNGQDFFLLEFLEFCKEEYNIHSVSKSDTTETLCAGGVTNVVLGIKDSSEAQSDDRMTKTTENNMTTTTTISHNHNRGQVKLHVNRYMTVTLVQINLLNHRRKLPSLQSLKDAMVTFTYTNNVIQSSSSNTRDSRTQTQGLPKQNKSFFVFKLPDSVDTPQEQACLEDATELVRILTHV